MDAEVKMSTRVDENEVKVLFELLNVEEQVFLSQCAPAPITSKERSLLQLDMIPKKFNDFWHPRYVVGQRCLGSSL